MPKHKIMILGVGNILLSDEGLGVQFLAELAKETLPESVELVEGGTAGLELIHLINGVDFLIIVDAIDAQIEPGALFRFRPEDIKVFPDCYKTSFHQVGILEVLSLASLLNEAPKTIIFGVQPLTVNWGIGLSPEVNQAFPRLKELVLEEIAIVMQDGRFSIA